MAADDLPFHDEVIKCAGNSPVPGEFPSRRPVPRSFDVFFDLRLNKRLSKQPWGWWFGTLSCPLWRHCNAVSDHLHWKPWVPLMPTLSSIRCHQWRQSWHYENLLFFSVKVYWWSDSIHPSFLGTCTWMAKVQQSLTKHNDKWNKHRITKSAIKDTGWNYIM